ncbi:MAG: methyltransferase domain-containing protein [Elusimicrobiota bacterium]
MIQELLNKIRFYNKIAYLFLKNKTVKPEDYAKDYDVISKTYNDTWIKEMSKHTSAMLDKLHYADGYTMLDLGCGTGYIIEESIKKVQPSKIVGIDNSKEMLRIAQSKLNHERTELICGDMISEIKKIPSNVFDIITCGWALPYVDTNQLIPEIYRVLKKNGQVAIITNRKGCINSIQKTFIKLMQKYPDKIRKITNMQYKLPGNAHEIRKMFYRNRISWVEGWDREQPFSFENGINAINWVMNTGAIAGTFKILDIKNYSSLLSDTLEKYFRTNNKVVVTHKFSVGIGRK